MKVSNKKLLESVSALNILLVQKLPVVISFKLSKNISQINAIFKIYEGEKKKIIEEYSVKDDEGKAIVDEAGNVQIKEEFKEIAQKEMIELLELENEIDLEIIQISKLENTNLTITPDEIMKINYMIQE